MSLQVVLVEPAGPLNVGSVARLCANFGIDGLRLVAPRCDPLGEEARRMAVHGVGLLERASLWPTLEAALADCDRVVATSGRLEGPPLPLLPPADALAWLLEGSAASQADPVPQPAEAPGALVFGREDRGLANGELLQAGRLLQIATGPSYSSLNLSHAVAVVLHELHMLRRGERSLAASPPPAAGATVWADPCRRQELEATLADAEALLLEVGFLLPHTSRARMAKLRALLQRAQVSEAEVALLRGMVCQLRWASRRRAGSGSDT
jgi:tRNA/rRNA methyltransferase